MMNRVSKKVVLLKQSLQAFFPFHPHIQERQKISESGGALTNTRSLERIAYVSKNDKILYTPSLATFDI
jgi:hypothetical protein